MDLDTVQAHFQDVFGFVGDVFHIGMNGAEAGKTAVLIHLLQNEPVDGVNMVRTDGHRQQYIMTDTGLCAPGKKHTGGTVHIFAQMVVAADAVGSLAGDCIRIYVGVNVDDFHGLAPRFG